MILFEPGGGAALRRGEFFPFSGLRCRTRIVPYPGFESGGADPWKAVYRRQTDEMRVACGAAETADWLQALRLVPTGRIGIGPVPRAESIYGAAAASLRACRELGIGVVAVDWHAAEESIDAGRDAVFVQVWRSGVQGRLWKLVAELSRRFSTGVALPLVPGWTVREDFLLEFIGRARRAGASFLVAFEVSGDGASRSAIHADYSAEFPGEADTYFDALHHGDWDEAVASGRRRFDEALAAAGLSGRVPLPRGRSDFDANLRAIEALEREAEARPEPAASRLRRAARRVENFGRDLSVLHGEGNTRLIFPPDSSEWTVVEQALAEAGGRQP